MAKKRLFGELELAILNIVKSKGQVTVKDVQQALGDEDVYTTVMTVMTRLADKGELQRKRVGRQYLYWVSSKNASFSFNIVDRLKQRLFGGCSSAMLSYLIDSSQDISLQELDEMKAIIDKAKKTRGR